MTRLNEFQKTFDTLGSIIGHEIIRNNGLAVILCLISTIGTGEEIDLATMSERTDIGPASLARYVELLKHAGVVELAYDTAECRSTIRLAQNTRQKVGQLFNVG